MQDYHKYSCAKLLEYLDGQYESDTDRTNYAEFLLKMQSAYSLKKLIEIYDKVLSKFLELSQFKYHSFYYKGVLLHIKEADEYLDGLHCFLNENIVRLFHELNDSDKFALECIVNLRKASNFDKVQESILSNCSKYVNSINDNILKNKAVMLEAPDYINRFNKNTNKAVDYKPKYKEAVENLMKYGYIRSFADSTFERESEIVGIKDETSLISYSISTLLGNLEYLDNNSAENTNYVQVLQSMKDSVSVNELLCIYDKVLSKFLEYYKENDRNSDTWKDIWYDFTMLPSSVRYNFKSLNAFLNIHIERLFKEKEYSDTLAVECFVNLRKAPNREEIQNIIMSKWDGLASISKDILASIEIVENESVQFSKKKTINIKYLQSISQYKNNLGYLKEAGYVMSIIDVTVEKRINAVRFFIQITIASGIFGLAITGLLIWSILSRQDFYVVTALCILTITFLTGFGFNFLMLKDSDVLLKTHKDIILSHLKTLGIIMLLFIVFFTLMFLLKSIGGIFGLIVLIGMPGALISFLRKG